MLIAKRSNGKKEPAEKEVIEIVFPEEQKTQLKSLHNMHHQFNDDGAPKWFFPTAIITNQGRTIECLNTLVNNVDSLTKAIDMLTEKVT